MPKSGGTDWVLLLLIATILVLLGITAWALLRLRKSRKDTGVSAPVEGTVMWPAGRAGKLAGQKPGEPPQEPEAPGGTVMWPKGQAARAAARPPAPPPTPAPPPPAPEAPEGTVMWPKGQAARAAARPPAPFSAPAAPEPPAEPERKESFFAALVRKCFPAKQPAPKTFSETVMFPRARGAGAAPESRNPPMPSPVLPPRASPGASGPFPAPAAKEDPGWARNLPPAPPRPAGVGQPPEAASPPGLTLQEEVELLRRQMRELQAQQNQQAPGPAADPPPREAP